MKKIFIIITIFIIIPDFANAFGVNSTMDIIFNSWKGENINTIINYWGYPDHTNDLNGRKLYYWEKTEESLGYTTIGNSPFFYSTNVSCTRILETNNNNIVINGQWKGNNCPATCLTARKFINPKNNPCIKKSIKIK